MSRFSQAYQAYQDPARRAQINGFYINFVVDTVIEHPILAAVYIARQRWRAGIVDVHEEDLAETVYGIYKEIAAQKPTEVETEGFKRRYSSTDFTEVMFELDQSISWLTRNERSMEKFIDHDTVRRAHWCNFAGYAYYHKNRGTFGIEA